MPHVQGLGQGASFIREDGVATTAFLLYLFSSKTDALQFLKDVGLIACNMQRPSCHAEMLFCSRLAPACARINALSTLTLLLLFP